VFAARRAYRSPPVPRPGLEQLRAEHDVSVQQRDVNDRGSALSKLCRAPGSFVYSQKLYTVESKQESREALPAVALFGPW
jgi:hypothetical protein